MTQNWWKKNLKNTKIISGFSLEVTFDCQNFITEKNSTFILIFFDYYSKVLAKTPVACNCKPQFTLIFIKIQNKIIKSASD